MALSLPFLMTMLTGPECQAQSVDDLDRENGAFGYKFGESITSFQGLRQSEQSKDGRVKVLIDENPKTLYLNFKTKQIEYCFFDDRLYRILIRLPDEETRLKAYNAAIALYGRSPSGSHWTGGLVRWQGGRNEISGPMIELLSIPLNHGYRAWRSHL